MHIIPLTDFLKKKLIIRGLVEGLFILHSLDEEFLLQFYPREYALFFFLCKY